MSASLVGSEMCIRDSPWSTRPPGRPAAAPCSLLRPWASGLLGLSAAARCCLLYTSDAADDM
eukprot:15099766-Alexandrium_andersonii.AAC.1